MVNIMEHLIKLDDLEVPLFSETSIYDIYAIYECPVDSGLPPRPAGPLGFHDDISIYYPVSKGL